MFWSTEGQRPKRVSLRNERWLDKWKKMKGREEMKGEEREKLVLPKGPKAALTKPPAPSRHTHQFIHGSYSNIESIGLDFEQLST